MALLLRLKSKKQLETDLDAKRLEMKALPEDERAGSLELSQLETLEKQRLMQLYSNFGVGFESAYARINSVNVTKSEATASVKIFESAEARESDEPAIASVTVSLDAPESVDTNLIAYAYEQLKLLPEFEGAVDV